MKRIIAALLACCMLLGLAACGQPAAPTPAQTPAQQDAAPEDEVFDVTLTLPADLVEDLTQEQLDESTAAGKYHSATRNEDGTVTFVMSKRQHQGLKDSVAASTREALEEMPGSEDYPNITSVKANEDFTRFTVTTSSIELSFAESFSVLSFYLYGGLYGVVSGQQPENIHVDFLNADTGEILESADSSEQVSR